MLKILIALLGLVVALLARNLDLVDELADSSSESSGESCSEISGDSSGDSSCYRNSRSRRGKSLPGSNPKYGPQDYRNIPRSGKGS